MLKCVHLADLEFRMLMRLMLSYIFVGGWRPSVPALIRGGAFFWTHMCYNTQICHSSLVIVMFGAKTVGIRTNSINVTGGQVVVSSLKTTGGVPPRILRITGE